MIIGLIKETKIPEDNRVALSPAQVVKLNQEFPDSEIIVQSSDIRTFLCVFGYRLSGGRCIDGEDIDSSGNEKQNRSA